MEETSIHLTSAEGLFLMLKVICQSWPILVDKFQKLPYLCISVKLNSRSDNTVMLSWSAVLGLLSW